MSLAQNNQWYLIGPHAENDTFKNAQRAADNADALQTVHRHRHGEPCPGFDGNECPCMQQSGGVAPAPSCTRCQGTGKFGACVIVEPRADSPIVRDRRNS